MLGRWWRRYRAGLLVERASQQAVLSLRPTRTVIYINERVVWVTVEPPRFHGVNHRT